MSESKFISELMDIETLPLMAIRGITVFPDMVITFDVERPMSLAALEAAYKKDRRIFLVAQKDILKEQPGRNDLYEIGTVAMVRQRDASPRLIFHTFCA